MRDFDKRCNEISEGLRSGLAKGIGTLGRVLTFPKRLDTGIADILKGQTQDIERKIGGQSYGAAVGDPSRGRAEEFSDLEKDLMLLMRKLKLTPNDARLQQQVKDLQKKIIQSR
jgi:hypothetical protein